jgi:uncharacterized protein YcbX
MSPPRPYVSALHYYPVKSCGGVPLERAVLGPRGFMHDREWMLVGAEGVFLSQRRLPRMALISPELDDEQLTLRAPGMPALAVPGRSGGRTTRVTVWRDDCLGVDEGDEAAEWLSTYLRAACRLVRFAEGQVRRVNPEYARSPDDQVGFADGYPFLLTSEASLRDLNARLAEPLPMDRFRPNIVVSGCDPYAEDGWASLRIGEVAFDVAKPCARCAITTVDQRAGTKGAEPLRTLAIYRRQGSGVMFGQNLIHRGLGQISVGNPVDPSPRAP